jgi:exodeoxyribonuclease-3
MRLATWNVAAVRPRTQQVCAWLQTARPDVLFLQEIKCEEPAFPAAPFAALGYQAAVVGQKAYNGVALLSRLPFTVVHRRLPGGAAEDSQARYLEVQSEGLTLAGLYAPNGNSGGEAGFAAKLAWMDRLRARAAELLAADTPLVLAGDFNVCPEAIDCAPGALAPTDALLHPAVRSRFRALLWLGLTDALRELHPGERLYTFWDYQGGAWPRDLGLRIDHVLLSPTLAERLRTATVERAERGREKPSDHVPVVVEF